MEHVRPTSRPIVGVTLLRVRLSWPAPPLTSSGSRVS